MTDISKEAVERLKSHIDWLRGDHNQCNPWLADTIEAQAARIAELDERQYKLAYAIAGGEDAHGLLDSVATEVLCKMVRDERNQQKTWIEVAAKMARADALRDVEAICDNDYSLSCPSCAAVRANISTLSPQETPE